MFFKLFCIACFTFHIVSLNAQKTKTQVNQPNLRFFFVESVPRIVNGEKAQKGQFPYQVFLVTFDRLSAPSGVCGGSIYSEDRIITAAHCVYDDAKKEKASYVQVLAGEVETPPLYTLKWISSEKIYFHRNYSNLEYDIAIIILQSPLQYTETIKNVALATKLPAENTVCNVSGWGSIKKIGGGVVQHLMYTTLQFKNRETCVSELPFNIPNTSICAQTPDHNICSGDSGGPLVCNGVQIGINGFVATDQATPMECLSSFPAFFTDVTQFHEYVLYPEKFFNEDNDEDIIVSSLGNPRLHEFNMGCLVLFVIVFKNILLYAI